MSGLLTIALNNVRFFAYHGILDEEKKNGNNFEVNLSVAIEPSAAVVHSIHDTINYVDLFDIVKKEIAIPTELLETVAMRIIENIHSSFPGCKKISFSMVKLHPPIADFTGNVGVSYSKEY